MSGVSRKVGHDLKDLRRKLRRLADGSAREKLKKNLLQELVEQVADGFRTGRSPEGYALWKPSWRSRYEGGMPLSDTGRLRNSLTGEGAEGFARTTALGFEVGSNLVYARIHNQGGVIKAKNANALVFWTKAFTNVGRGGRILKRAKRVGFDRVVVQQVTIPTRQFLPDKGILPERWREAFDDVARETLDTLLKKKR